VIDINSFLTDATEYVPHTLLPEDGNISKFQNVVFFRIQDDEQSKK
jgi:hypothetical protein